MSRDPSDTFGYFDSTRRWKFDPEFDDRAYRSNMYAIPMAQVGKGSVCGGFVVGRRVTSMFEVFGKRYKASNPLDVRVLHDKEDRIWMSDSPQERMMMYANASRSCGSTLVGGLGLGMFPQYAQYGVGGYATRLTIVERSAEVIELVRPTLEVGLKVPFTIIHATIEEYLSTCRDRFDTIFLDTWDSLEPKRLPEVNALRELAFRRVRCGGRILLWGYRWMVELFARACNEFLSCSRDRRSEIIAQSDATDSDNGAVLRQIDSYFHGYPPSRNRRVGIATAELAVRVSV